MALAEQYLKTKHYRVQTKSKNSSCAKWLFRNSGYHVPMNSSCCVSESFLQLLAR